jgi:uncharacterized protein (TIGR00290 family)
MKKRDDMPKDTFAMMWSGGKDSSLALWRARQAGLAANRIINFYDMASQRVRFHAFRKEIVVAQADAMGVALTQIGTDAAGYADTFRKMLKDLRKDGFKGVVFGNIHLRDVYEFCAAGSAAAGLEHVEPLWGHAPAELLADFVRSGFTAVVTCCQLEKLGIDWLGREVNQKFLEEIKQVSGVDPCGENGEYHTCVTGGPIFRRALIFCKGETRLSAGFAQVDVEMGA